MCFDLKVINQFRGSNASILKLQCKFTPDITIIPAAFNNNQLKIAIVAPLNFINSMRSIVEKFQCVYPCFAFYTQDGTCIRHVSYGEIIGKGNINGFDENNFGKIFIPERFDKVIIVINNHRSKLSVLEDKIETDLQIDFNKLKDNLILAIEKGTTSIDVFIDYPLSEHLKNYDFLDEFSKLSEIDEMNVKLFSTQHIENYCLRFICETYFGLLEYVSNKGVNIELNIEKLIYYTTEADLLCVQIAYNEIRKTFTLIVKSNECIEFDVILFIAKNISTITPKSGLIRENIDIIEYEFEPYPYLNGEEFSRIINLLQNLDIQSISRFNIYPYKFSPIPLFTQLYGIIPEIEFKHLLDYMWKKINEEEMKYNKNGYQSIFGISEKIKKMKLERFSSSYVDSSDQLFSYFHNDMCENA